MTHLRISIARLLAAVVAIAFGMVSLRFASEAVAGVLFLVTLSILSVPILGIICRRGTTRVLCLGSALWGWGYMALAADFWLGLTEHHPDSKPTTSGAAFGPERVYGAKSPHARPFLITSEILDHFRPYLQTGAGLKAQSPSLIGTISGNDSRTRQILLKLRAGVPITFANETPLEEVLAYIKNMTAGVDFPAGIPIYVDPVGLHEVQKTMASPVVMDVGDIPLGTALETLLAQLELGYQVRDGLLTISAATIIEREEDIAVLSFRRVGHCYFAMLAAILGGFVGHIIGRTSSRRRDRPVGIGTTRTRRRGPHDSKPL